MLDFVNIMYGNQQIKIDISNGFIATVKDRKGNSTTLIINRGIVSEKKGATLVPSPKAVFRVLQEYDRVTK